MTHRPLSHVNHSTATFCASGWAGIIFADASGETVKICRATRKVFLTHAVVTKLIARAVDAVASHAHWLSTHSHSADLRCHTILIRRACVARSCQAATLGTHSPSTQSVSPSQAGRHNCCRQTRTPTQSMSSEQKGDSTQRPSVASHRCSPGQSLFAAHAPASAGTHVADLHVAPGSCITHTHLGCTSAISATGFDTRTGHGIAGSQPGTQLMLSHIRPATTIISSTWRCLVTLSISADSAAAALL